MMLVPGFDTHPATMMLSAIPFRYDTVEELALYPGFIFQVVKDGLGE